jgi:hypothetical protein
MRRATGPALAIWPLRDFERMANKVGDLTGAFDTRANSSPDTEPWGCDGAAAREVDTAWSRNSERETGHAYRQR